MTEPAHTIEWTPDAVLDTDAVTIVAVADQLEQRTKKPTEFVPLSHKLDTATWDMLKQLANGGTGEPA